MVFFEGFGQDHDALYEDGFLEHHGALHQWFGLHPESAFREDRSASSGFFSYLALRDGLHFSVATVC